MFHKMTVQVDIICIGKTEKYYRVLLEMNCQTTGITVGVLPGVVGVAVGMSGLIGGAIIAKRHVDR